MEPRKQDVEYYLTIMQFLLRPRERYGRNFRLSRPRSRIPAQKLAGSCAARADVMLDDTDSQNYYISYERGKSLPQNCVTNLQSGESRRLEFRNRLRRLSYLNREYDTAKFRYGTSRSYPPSVFEYVHGSGASTSAKQKEFLAAMTAPAIGGAAFATGIGRM